MARVTETAHLSHLKLDYFYLIIMCSCKGMYISESVFGQIWFAKFFIIKVRNTVVSTVEVLFLPWSVMLDRGTTFKMNIGNLEQVLLEEYFTEGYFACSSQKSFFRCSSFMFEIWLFDRNLTFFPIFPCWTGPAYQSMIFFLEKYCTKKYEKN